MLKKTTKAVYRILKRIVNPIRLVECALRLRREHENRGRGKAALHNRATDYRLTEYYSLCQIMV